MVFAQNDLSQMEEPVIVVHGGAAAYALVERDNINKSDIEDGVIDAAKAGYDILSSGGTAIDAVQAAVLKMEDNPIFNCGWLLVFVCLYARMYMCVCT